MQHLRIVQREIDIPARLGVFETDEAASLDLHLEPPFTVAAQQNMHVLWALIIFAVIPRGGTSSTPTAPVNVGCPALGKPLLAQLQPRQPFCNPQLLLCTEVRKRFSRTCIT